jgi:hypothetical protein
MDLLKSIFITEAEGVQIPSYESSDIFIVMLTAIVLGIVIACCYMFKNEYSRNLIISVSILPIIVAMLIMLVSFQAQLNAAIAIGGVFALTRFRSVQGTSKEITQILLAMATGLILGLGYILVSIILVVVVEAMCVIFNITNFGEANSKRRTLKITIPEELDYNDLFDDIFKKYTTKAVLVKVKLKNLGTLFQLTYDVVLKDGKTEKQFIDELRVRNANLDILCSKVIANPENL